MVQMINGFWMQQLVSEHRPVGEHDPFRGAELLDLKITTAGMSRAAGSPVEGAFGTDRLPVEYMKDHSRSELSGIAASIAARPNRVLAGIHCGRWAAVPVIVTDLVFESCACKDLLVIASTVESRCLGPRPLGSGSRESRALDYSCGE